MLLKEFKLQTSRKTAQQLCIKMLGESISSLLKLLKQVTERGFKASLGSEKTRKCSPKRRSYCCVSLGAKDMSGARDGAESPNHCVRIYSSYDDVVMGSGNSSRVMAKTMKTPREEKELQENAGDLAGRGRRKRRRETLHKIDPSLFEQSLPKWPSLLEEICRREGVVVKSVYSIVTSEWFEVLRSEVSRLLKTILTQYLSSDEIYSHPGGLSGSQERVNLVKLLLRKVCSGVLTSIEVKYSVS